MRNPVFMFAAMLLLLGFPYKISFKAHAMNNESNKSFNYNCNKDYVFVFILGLKQQ